MAMKKAAGKRKAPARKKAPAKRKTASKAAPAIKTKLSKSQLHALIAESADLSKKQVASVFDGLESLIERSIKKGGTGEFTLPGLLKITTVKKPARKARKGVNPFTGQETMFKAKPASTVVKVRALKKMKEFTGS